MTSISPSASLEFTTLSDQVARSLSRDRLLATLATFFGGLALLLALIGLYGTMSNNVARRKNEIGIRIALGAARERVIRMVIGEVGVVVVAGLGLGVVLALAATRLVASFLFGLTATDPLTWVGSAGVLLPVALLAGVAPAWLRRPDESDDGVAGGVTAPVVAKATARQPRSRLSATTDQRQRFVVAEP